MYIVCVSQHDSCDNGAATGLDVSRNSQQFWSVDRGECGVHMQAVGEDDDDSDDEDMPPLEDAK